jgi:hypothetical protein
MGQSEEGAKIVLSGFSPKLFRKGLMRLYEEIGLFPFLDQDKFTVQ